MSHHIQVHSSSKWKCLKEKYNKVLASFIIFLNEILFNWCFWQTQKCPISILWTLTTCFNAKYSDGKMFRPLLCFLQCLVHFNALYNKRSITRVRPIWHSRSKQIWQKWTAHLRRSWISLNVQLCITWNCVCNNETSKRTKVLKILKVPHRNQESNIYSNELIFRGCTRCMKIAQCQWLSTSGSRDPLRGVPKSYLACSFNGNECIVGSLMT